MPPSSKPAISQVMKAANIPIVTYDIADQGMYFVGIDNLAAGIAGRRAVGSNGQGEVGLQSDLVICEGAAAGIVTNGGRRMRTG